MSLIDTLGLGYCRDQITEALVAYNGEPYVIERIREDGITLRHLREPNNYEALPASWLSGFSVLEYPNLGYRKFNGLALWVSRSTSYRRGLCASLCTLTYSDASNVLHRERAERATENYGEGWAIYAEVVVPIYDSPGVLRQVLNNEALCFVPHENMMVEPSLTSDNFIIMYANKEVGTISRDGTISCGIQSVHRELTAYLNSTGE